MIVILDHGLKILASDMAWFYWFVLDSRFLFYFSLWSLIVDICTECLFAKICLYYLVKILVLKLGLTHYFIYKKLLFIFLLLNIKLSILKLQQLELNLIVHDSLNLN